MKRKTVWSVFRDFVNDKTLGSVISRNEIINKLRAEGFVPQRGFFEHKDKEQISYSLSTLDCARNMAEKVGYLGKTRKNGYYEVLRHFPSDYTVSKLRRDYDNRVYAC